MFLFTNDSIRAVGLKDSYSSWQLSIVHVGRVVHLTPAAVDRAYALSKRGPKAEMIQAEQA